MKRTLSNAVIALGAILVGIPMVTRVLADQRGQPNSAMAQTLAEDFRSFIGEGASPQSISVAASVDELIAKTDPPWPTGWKKMMLNLEDGLTVAAVLPVDDVGTLVFRGSNPGQLVAMPSVALHSEKWSVGCDVYSLNLRPFVLRTLTRIAAEHDVGPDAVDNIRNRITGMSQLDIVSTALRMAASPPNPDSKELEDVLLAVTLGRLNAGMGSGDRCRIVSSGTRTVLCFSDESLVRTRQAVISVFEDGIHLYHFVVSRARPSQIVGDGAALDEKLAAIYRSILYSALRSTDKN